jgi:hypothetical protein
MRALLEGAQGMDYRAHFHPIIRGEFRATVHVSLMLTRTQDGTPTPGSRVALACAVGKNRDVGQGDWIRHAH